MDFSFSKEQSDLFGSYRAFGAEHLNDGIGQADQSGIIEPDHYRQKWRMIADFGVLGLAMPKSYGGLGHSIETATAALIGLGEGCHDNGLLLAINAQLWTVLHPILEFGTEEQKQEWLPRIVSGDIIGCDAVSEAQSGSDAMGVTTTAREIADGFILDGAKVYVGQATTCDLAVVFAQTTPDAGAWGVSAFLVPMDADGVSRSEPLEKTGYRTIANGTLNFENVHLPSAALLGRLGAGKAIFGRSSTLERQLIFASHVGAMKRQLDECVLFAKSRKSGGGAIAQYQSVSNRLADMQARYETCWLMQMRAAWQVDQGQETPQSAALTKLVISEALLASSLDASRIHAGPGYAFDTNVSRDIRDHLGSVFLGGTSDVQRNIVAKLLRPEKR
jgi:alkylation response protein AidB-like acyl-CoA dehydrogenase